MNNRKLTTELHPKIWGEEAWLVNNELYCGKVLLIKRRHHCSIHSHKLKDETFHVARGAILLELDFDDSNNAGTKIFMTRGDTIRIKPGEKHRFTGVSEEPAQILEISTSHHEDDSYRITPSGLWSENEMENLMKGVI